jgi:anti-sigma factor RsiW
VSTATATATNTRGHLSSETIDLLLLSALPADESNAAKAHLDECERCRTRWRELNEDKQRFEQFVFARTLPKVEARAAQAKGSFFERFKLAIALPAFGLVAAGAIAVVALTGGGTQTEDEVYVGVKGQGPSLTLFAARTGGGAFEVKRGGSLQPKDRIRFVVNPGNAKYLLIASRDGAGAFSVYHPFGAAQSVKLASQARLELNDAVELDETLGNEKVVAVFSDAPVQAAEVEAALKANPADPKLPNATLVTWDFVKVHP